MAAVNDLPQLVDKKKEDGPFQPKTADGDAKPESQYTPDEKRVGLRNANHTQTLDLADIYERFFYEDNLIQRRYSDTKKALVTTLSSTAISTAFFSNNVIQDFQENSDDEVDERSMSKDFQPKFTPKLIRSFSNSNSQADPKLQKDYKDEEEVSDEEEVTHVKVLMALADDELTVGKGRARNGEWVDVTLRKVNTLLSMDEDVDWQNYLNYINIDLKFVEEQRLNLLSNKLLNFNTGRILVLEGQAVNESLESTKTLNTPESSKDFKAESLTPLPPLKNLQGASPSSEVNSNKKTQESDPKIQNTESSKAVDSSRMSQDSKPKFQNTSSSKSLRPKPNQKPQLKCELCHYANHLTNDCYRILYCVICKKEDHRTSDHEMYTASLKRRMLPESSQSSESLIGVECNICGSTVHSTTDHNEFDHFKRACEKGKHHRASFKTKQNFSTRKCLHLLHMDLFGPVSLMSMNHEKYTLVIVDEYSRTDNRTEFRNHELESFCDEKGIYQNFSSPYTPEQNGVAKRKNKILIEAAKTILNGSETYHVTFDESIEAIRFTHTSEDEIGINDSFRYPSVEFVHEDDPSRQYQIDSDISYCVIPHARSLSKLTQDNQVSEVIAPNDPDIPHTENTKGPPDLINTKGTHEQNVQNDQMITQATDVPLVARMEAFRIFLAFATYMIFKVYQMDVKSAFPNGKLKKEVYVQQPPSFESSEFPDYVCKLDKALYGLKQVPKAWYETLSTFIIQNKLIRGIIDNTLFIYKSKRDVLLIQVYVDDIIFSSTSYKLCKQFKKLMTKKFEMSIIGELTYFLRLQIKQDDKGISICQEQYTRNLLKKYEISDSSSVKTPMVPPNNLGPDLAGKPVNETSYRGMIGSLMYLTATRPDIQFPTVLCVRYQSNLEESHLTAVKRILRKSTSGACQILGGKLVCWSAKKQQSVAMSSSEAEYVVVVGVMQGPEASGALSKKRKKPKSKKPPTETKVTPPKTTEGSKQSHLVSSGSIPDPQNLKRNIQLSSMGLPSTLDEGIRKSQPFPEGTAKTTSRPEGSLGDKTQGETYHPLIWNQYTLLLLIFQVAKEVRIPSPKQDEPKLSYVQESTSDSSSPDLKKFDNTLLLTGRQLIKYLRKKSRVLFKIKLLVETTMSTIDRSSTEIKDLYQGLSIITKLLKDINTVVKDDPTTNKKFDEAIETFAKISTTTIENLGSRMTAIEISQTTLKIPPTQAQPITTIATHPESSQAASRFDKGKGIATESDKDPSKKMVPASTNHHKLKAQPITTIATHSESFRAASRIDKGKGIATESDKDPSKKMVPASTIVRPDPDEEVKVLYMINGKMCYLTNTELQAYLDKEKKLRKAIEEARLLAISKPEVIKVVHEVTEKIRLDPKKIASAKAGEKFKKAQDAEHESDIDKVRMEALVSYPAAASMVQSPENARFSMKLKKLVAEHLDQKKLKSKKVKLEALRHEMN
nr:retrovirus-related Pol polyprotein from transposon TNT 1-94 [Tanacetum cinerariifolium]